MKFVKRIVLLIATFVIANGLIAAESIENDKRQAVMPTAHWTMDKIEHGIIKDIARGHDARITAPKKRKSQIGGKLLPDFEPQIVPGIIGNALALIGAQQGYLTLPRTKDFSPAGGLTVMAWIKPATRTANMEIITCKPDSNTAKNGWSLSYSWGRLIFKAVDTTGKAVSVSSAENSVHWKNWQHAAVVIEKDKVRLYLNCNECGSIELTAPLAEPELPLIIGNHATIYTWCHEKCPAFSGLLDEVKIFSQALDSEILFNEVDAQLPSASSK